MLELNILFTIICIILCSSIVNSNYMEYDIYNGTPVNGQNENVHFLPSTRESNYNKNGDIDKANYLKNVNVNEVKYQNDNENESINVTTADLKFVELNKTDSISLHPETDLLIQLNVTFSKQSVPPNDTEELLNSLNSEDAINLHNHIFKNSESYHICRRLQHNQFTCYTIPIQNLKPYVKQRLHKIFHSKQPKIPYLCDLTNRKLFEQSEYCKKLKMYKKTYMKLKYQSLIPTDLVDNNKTDVDGLFYFCGFDDNNFDANICWPVNNSNNSKEISYSMPILEKHIRSNTTLLCYVAKERNNTQITCWPTHHVSNHSSVFPTNQTYICNVIYKIDSVKLTKCWLNTSRREKSILMSRNDSFVCEYKTDGSLLSEFVCRLRHVLDDLTATASTPPMYAKEDFNNVYHRRQQFHNYIRNSRRVRRNSFEHFHTNQMMNEPQVLKVKFNDITYIDEHPNSTQLTMSLVMNRGNETENHHLVDENDKHSTSSFDSSEERKYSQAKESHFSPKPTIQNHNTTTPKPSYHHEPLTDDSIAYFQSDENVSEDPISNLEKLIEDANFSNPHDMKQIVQDVLAEISQDLKNRTTLHAGDINNQLDFDLNWLKNLYNSSHKDVHPDEHIDASSGGNSHVDSPSEKNAPPLEMEKPESDLSYKTSFVDTNKFDKIFFKFIMNHQPERKCSHRNHQSEPIIKTKLFSFIPFTHIVHHQVVQIFPDSNNTEKHLNVPETVAFTNHTKKFYKPQVITKIPNNWFNLMSSTKDIPNLVHYDHA